MDEKALQARWQAAQLKRKREFMSTLRTLGTHLDEMGKNIPKAKKAVAEALKKPWLLFDEQHRGRHFSAPVSGATYMGQEGQGLLHEILAFLTGSHAMAPGFKFDRLGADGPLRAELTRLAHAHPETRQHIVPLLRKYAVATKTWMDGDRSAPWTPWGPAQHGYQLDRGVWLYGTAGHGGLAVANGVARKKLSAAAIKVGFSKGGYYWYEEDADALVPLYDVPEWAKAAVQVGAIGAGWGSPEKFLPSLKRNHPRYLAEVAKAKV